ncbi:hypothetical protein [Aquibaculum arenosum]|uniref:Serine/threonine protein phosphatase n=1 Tax=Aquibaculum arenosum TaxID=3032591 RepID=A0ABT5YR84_9PROT|nr:hypothetical protein [Fodinicurvata sp. CAU 1616]MDF2097347.1 hypothetical protein [Fodinicurvata sp. CAU 1616]
MDPLIGKQQDAAANMAASQIFATLTDDYQRVWAVASIHGEVGRLEALHAGLWDRLRPGDRLVYLGNAIGRGPDSCATIDELLSFRRAFMTLQPEEAPQVVFLRGAQEEMWQKLLQLQFATDPPGVLEWMLQQGVAETLAAYGFDMEEARRAASSGAVGVTRWTQALRQRIQAAPGHYAFMGEIRRAALTDDGALLFVNAGLDPSRPLETQRDSFWWSSAAFARMSEPYGSYHRVVRGFDPRHPGVEIGDFTATLDAGCGFGGTLLAACVLPDGTIEEALEA